MINCGHSIAGGGTALAEDVVRACRVRVVVRFAAANRHSGRAGDNGRGDQQHERRADLHRGQEGLLPRRRPRRQSDQFPLGGGHGGAGSASAGLYNAVARGIKIKIVADKASSSPGYGGTKILVRKNHVESGRYRSLQDLKGMKFAMNAPGVSNTSTLNTLLQSAGLKYSDVETVDLPLPDHVAALKKKSVDASASVEPGPALTIRNGDAVLIKSDDEILPNHQIAVLLYSEEFASKRADAARRFMRAYIRAVRFYNGALKNGRLDGANADDVIAILSEAP